MGLNFYIFQTSTIIASGFLVVASYVNRAKKFKPSVQWKVKKCFSKKKISALVTVGIMQLGFTVSLSEYFAVLI